MCAKRYGALTRILDLLVQSADHPSRVEFLPDGVETSFEALWRLSEKAAGALSGFPEETPVLGVLTSSPSAIATLIGAWRAGLTFVSAPMPHRGQDARSYTVMLNQLIRATGAEAIISEARYSGLFDQAAAPLRSTERLVEPGRPMRESDRGALVQFSSGTLGSPKAIRLTQTDIAENVTRLLQRLRVGPGDSSCQWTPLSHDMGLVGGLLATWASANRAYLGGEAAQYVCIRPESFLQNPGVWMEACSRTRSTITAAPTFAYAMAARTMKRAPSPLDLSALRVCIVGAEPVDPDVLAAFTAAGEPFGLSRTALTPAYGLAEAALCVTMANHEEVWSASDFRLDEDDDRAVQLVSCGAPLDGYSVQAGTTAAAPILVEGPSVQVDRCGGDVRLDTGDVGYVRNGELYVAGRTDDVLAIRGRAVLRHDLVNVATAACAHVRPGNCTAVRSGSAYAVLFECRRPPPDHGELERACWQLRLALTRAVGIAPHRIAALETGTLPKTPSGKLRQLHIQRDLSQYLASAVYTTGRDHVRSN